MELVRISTKLMMSGLSQSEAMKGGVTNINFESWLSALNEPSNLTRIIFKSNKIANTIIVHTPNGTIYMIGHAPMWSYDA